MGDISIIARRLKDGHVQYGWSGNGGYYKTVGLAIEKWYTTPEMVEYLFGLGQLRLLVAPLTDTDQHWRYPTMPTGEPHYLGCSENDIFSKILFIDYAYFYDLDERWYYIQPGPFRIKIPLEEVSKYLEFTGEDHESNLFRKIQAHIIRIIADDWYHKDESFHRLADAHGFDREQVLRLYNKILQTEDLSEDDEDYEYWEDTWRYFCDRVWLLDYFDSWVLVANIGDGTSPEKIIMRKRTEPREETIYWGWKNEA